LSELDVESSTRIGRLRSRLLSLCSIPSRSAWGEGESQVMDFIGRTLDGLCGSSRGLKVFRYPLPLDPFGRHHVAALWRHPGGGRATVVLVPHVDVVDERDYGSLSHLAFDPVGLTEALKGCEHLPKEARRDLELGYLFGRGTLDVKAGLAIEMVLMEELAMGTVDVGVNVLFLPVVDEERDSVGMRGAVGFMRDLAEAEGLDYVACVNTEPSELGSSGEDLPIFIGSVGKLMPFALLVGKGAHVGEPWQGLNAAYLASRVVSSLEGVSWSAESLGDQKLPPMTCIGLEILRDSYSVTLPDMAMAYFNKLTVSSDHRSLLDRFKAEVMISLKEAVGHIAHEFRLLGLPEIHVAKGSRVLEVREVIRLAQSMGFDPNGAASRLDPREDTRGQSVRVLLEALRVLRLEPPVAVVGFLPPYYPPKLNRGCVEKDARLRKEMERLASLWSREEAIRYRVEEVFGGITDLSFLGGFVGEEDFAAVMDNMPGGSHLYPMDYQAMACLDVPVVNLGVKGRDAHKWTERLDLAYSFGVLPDLMIQTLRALGGSADLS